MLDRDRRSLRAFREEEAERERLAAEESERPIREATAKLIEGHRKLAGVERERLTSIPDPGKWIDDSLVGPTVRMTKAQALEFNADQIRAYQKAHPDVFWGPELFDLLGAYFERNSLKLVSTAMLERLIDRFSAVGLLPARPAEPEPEPIVEEQPPVVVEPETFEGIDPDTGEVRTYTARQVNRMDSTEYRRAFKITKAQLAPPTHSAF